MRQNPSLQDIQQNMKPGSLSAHGFLGEDTRNLADILSEDDSVVMKLDITHKALADRMHYFTQYGKKGLESPVIVDDIYEVVVEEYRGLISCPFRDHFRAAKKTTRITNLKTGQTACWTDLNTHMIYSHGFYEGRGSYFRINPEELAIILGIL